MYYPSSVKKELKKRRWDKITDSIMRVFVSVALACVVLCFIYNTFCPRQSLAQVHYMTMRDIHTQYWVTKAQIDNSNMIKY